MIKGKSNITSFLSSLLTAHCEERSWAGWWRDYCKNLVWCLSPSSPLPTRRGGLGHWQVVVAGHGELSVHPEPILDLTRAY